MYTPESLVGAMERSYRCSAQPLVDWPRPVVSWVTAIVRDTMQFATVCSPRLSPALRLPVHDSPSPQFHCRMCEGLVTAVTAMTAFTKMALCCALGARHAGVYASAKLPSLCLALLSVQKPQMSTTQRRRTRLSHKQHRSHSNPRRRHGKQQYQQVDGDTRLLRL